MKIFDKFILQFFFGVCYGYAIMSSDKTGLLFLVGGAIIGVFLKALSK